MPKDRSRGTGMGASEGGCALPFMALLLAPTAIAIIAVALVVIITGATP